MNLSETRRELHRFPETGFREFKTQEYLIRKLKITIASFLKSKPA